MLLEVLDADEELLLRFGDLMLVLQLDVRQFQRAKEVRDLKEPILGGGHFRNERGLGRVDGEGFLQQRQDLRLSVVVVDLQPVVAFERGVVVQQEVEHLLQQVVVNGVESKLPDSSTKTLIS